MAAMRVYVSAVASIEDFHVLPVSCRSALRR
jgi:hypothetical protein